MVVGDELGGLFVVLLRHIIHLRPRAWVAHRQIILGVVARSVGTFASRLAAAFVTLHEGASQDFLKRGELSQKCLAAFSQGGGRLVVHALQTTCLTGPVSYTHLRAHDTVLDL